MNTIDLQEFNEELSKISCPKHHQSAVLERFYYGKPKFSNVCCKEHELACAKLVADYLLRVAQIKNLSGKRRI